MRLPLDGARLKIVRAQKHLDAFKQMAEAFVKANRYAFESEVYGDYWWLKPRVTTQPDPDMGLILGDCVNNARSAADYIVWQLALRYFNPAADITNRDDRRITAFPIFEDSASNNGYADRVQRLSKRGVPAAALDAINSAQPDVSGNPSLFWLHELVNTDKHRVPVVAIGIIDGAQVAIRNYQNRAWLIRSELLRDAVSIKAPADLLAAIKSEQVEVDLQATLMVTTADVAMPRIPLDVALQQIIETVSDLIPRFERFLPYSAGF